MEKIKTGGPAFPTTLNNPGNEPVAGFDDEPVRARSAMEYRGLSIRDYFAAKAMAAIIEKTPLVMKPSGSKELTRIRASAARSAYAYADAMLAERGE